MRGSSTPKLSAVSGIGRVDVSTRTGSLLLRFDPSVLRSPDFLDAVSEAMGKLFPAHVAPGRLRITVKRLKGRPELALKMEEHLAPVWGIDRVEIDPATGSCLLLYDSQAVASPEFLDALSQRLAALLPRFDVRKLISRVGMRG